MSDTTSCANASAHRRDDKPQLTNETSDLSTQKDLFSSSIKSDSLSTDQDKDKLTSLDQVPNDSQRTSEDDVRLQGEVRQGPIINPIDPAISDKAGVNDQTFKSGAQSSTADVPLPKSVDDLTSKVKLSGDYDDSKVDNSDEYKVKDISDLPLDNLKFVNTDSLQQDVAASSVEEPHSRGVVQTIKDTAVGLAQKAMATVQGSGITSSTTDVPLPKSVDDLTSGKLPDDYDDNEVDNSDEYKVKDISDLPLDNLKIINTGTLQQDVAASSVEEPHSRGVVQTIKDTAVGLAQKAMATVQGSGITSSTADVPLPKSVDDLTSGKLPDDYDDNEADNSDEYKVKDISDLPLDNLKIINTGALQQDVAASSVEVPEEQQSRGVVKTIKDTAVGLAQKAMASMQIATERVKETALEAIHKVQEMDQRATETINIASHKANEKMNDMTIKAQDGGVVVPEDQTVRVADNMQIEDKQRDITSTPQDVNLHPIKAQQVDQTEKSSSSPAFAEKIKDYAQQAAAKAQMKSKDLGYQAQVKTQEISEQASQVKKEGGNILSEAAHNFVSKAKEYDQQLQADLQAQSQTYKQTENISQFTMKQDLALKDQEKKVEESSDKSKQQEWPTSQKASDVHYQAQSSTPINTETTSSGKLGSSSPSPSSTEDISKKIQEFSDKAKQTASEWKEKAKEKVKEVGNEASWKVSEKLEKGHDKAKEKSDDLEGRTRTKSDAPHPKVSHKKTKSTVPEAPPVPLDNPPEKFFQDLDTKDNNLSDETDVMTSTTSSAPISSTIGVVSPDKSVPIVADTTETTKAIDNIFGIADTSATTSQDTSQAKMKEEEFPALPAYKESDKVSDDNKDLKLTISGVSQDKQQTQSSGSQLKDQGVTTPTPVSPAVFTPTKSYASVVAKSDTSSKLPEGETHKSATDITSRSGSEDVEPNAVKDQLGSRSTSK